MKMNEEQRKAVFAPVNQDVLISAGAGSGKTATLTEHVFTLIENGDIRPDEILVLTFTNNAAHEMKTRILQRFGPSHPEYARMLSSHVQSFDSFNAYLVRCYAGRLGISTMMTILPSTLLERKKALLIDEVLEESYKNDEIRAKIVDFMCKLGLKTDSSLKNSISVLLNKFDAFTPEKRAEFITRYDDRFLSDQFIADLHKMIEGDAKKRIETALRNAFALDQIAEVITKAAGDEPSPETIASAVDSVAIWNVELKDMYIKPCPSVQNDFLPREFECFRDMLGLPFKELCAKAAEVIATNEFFGKGYTKLRAGAVNVKDFHYRAHAYYELKTLEGLFRTLSSIDDDAETKKRIRYFQEGIHVLLGLVVKVQERLDAYKRSHNAYSFGDITALALSLFIDPAYEDIAEQLRDRFRYVMVDEYQDTNDFQEIFLEGLLKPRKDGGRAHLFCVGDAKQSIYAFRNSNVELFRKRQRAYATSPEATVIAMNTNYRSAKRLLEDINHIFRHYMTLDLGGIDYSDEMESLHYDDKVNLYNVDLPGYGVHRILPPQSTRLHKTDVSMESFRDADYEAHAILADIQKKLKEGFQVFDRKLGHERPCRKSDFCILVRRGREKGNYQRLFTENGIALNNHLKLGLNEVPAVLLVRSLLNLLGFALGQEDINLEHAFASVARSYAFHYDDDVLDKILRPRNKDDQPRERVLADPLYQKIVAFASNHKDAAFAAIFLDLLHEFDVISNLYLVGDVEDNLSKIEALYTLLLTEQSLGEGLKDFIEFFADLSRRDLDIDSETIIESADAVDLMTIHASKGLERKIVYLVSSECGKSRGSNMDKPPFEFSEELGILFPYLEVPNELVQSISTETLARLANKIADEDIETNEHVRVLYVALTRAENTVIIVGRDKGWQSAYIMMERVPSFLRINPKLLSYPWVPVSAVKNYENSLRPIPALPSPNSFVPVAYPLLQRMHEGLVQGALERERALYAHELLKALLGHYLERFKELRDDYDALSCIYASVFLPFRKNRYKIDGFDKLFAALKSDSGDEDSGEDGPSFDDASEDNEDSQDQTVTLDTSLLFKDKDTLKKALDAFYEGVLSGSLEKAFPLHFFAQSLLDKETKTEGWNVKIDALLYPLAQYFDHVDYVYYRSYQTPEYKDQVTIYDLASFTGNEKPSKPTLPAFDIDDTELDFPLVASKRASKKAFDSELPSQEALQRGTRLHRYLELLNFDTLDLSFISNEGDKAIIEALLGSPLMKRAIAAKKAYHEYGYYDEENLTSGFIDLLFVEDGIYHIVDYKTSSIEDPAYDEQLNAYARNVMRLFNVDKDHIQLHLISIRGAKTRDVPVL